jgi:hypothetical protein
MLALAAACAAGEARKTERLLETSFERPITDWTQQGEGLFGVDAGQVHSGKQALRIHVADEQKPWYQQWQYELADVAPGDRFQARLWVRTRGVDTDPGAYFVLEFLDFEGRRTGIAHSQTGAANGRLAWQELTARGRAPGGTRRLRVGLVLHARGTAWFDDVEVVRTMRAKRVPDLGDAERSVKIRTDQVVHPSFGGVGFHVFHHVHDIPSAMLDQVVAKRWRELNPSFARMNDRWDWDRATLDRVAEHMLRLKATGTEIYLATWGPKDTKAGGERAAYAKRVVDNLEYLVRQKGCTNIKTYCMSNELSLNGWGTLRRDLPKFRDYHQELYDELDRRGLDIQLLATDASPIGSWHTIEWAAEHMDNITGVYGGHHYINHYPPEDLHFYPWFLEKLTWGAGSARGKGKNFILGEFGCKQDGRVRHGKKWDACIYWDTPREPLVGIQLAEAAIAAINAGVYALGNWTFMDFPDDYREHYANKWGVFKWSGEDTARRDHYYAYGLLTKFFRGPAVVLKVTGNDPRLRAAALRHHGDGTWSIALVNRNEREVPLRITVTDGPRDATFRKYVYDAAAVPQHPFGDLQTPAARVAMSDGTLTDALSGGTLTVYTTACDDQPPKAVAGLKIERRPDGAQRLTWRPNREADLCYYRIHRLSEEEAEPGVETEIGTTVSTEFVDEMPQAGARYAVVAVDQSGNASSIK